MHTGLGVVKLIDFGSAGYVTDDTFGDTFTAHYAAPTQIKGSQRDVYSLGVLLHQLVYRKFPGKGFGEGEYVESSVEWLIREMMASEHTLECKDVLAHEWLVR